MDFIQQSDVTRVSRGSPQPPSLLSVAQSPPSHQSRPVSRRQIKRFDSTSYLDIIAAKLENECGVFLEDDFEGEQMRPYGFVFSPFHTRSNHVGSVGVIGPSRMQYDLVIPVVRYFGSLLGEVADW